MTIGVTLADFRRQLLRLRSGWTYGVKVTCEDLDFDGFDEIITGPGPGPGEPTLVRGWNYYGGVLELMAGTDFFAFDEATVFYGVNVAGGTAQ